MSTTTTKNPVFGRVNTWNSKLPNSFHFLNIQFPSANASLQLAGIRLYAPFPASYNDLVMTCRHYTTHCMKKQEKYLLFLYKLPKCNFYKLTLQVINASCYILKTISDSISFCCKADAGRSFPCENAAFNKSFIQRFSGILINYR